MVEIRPTEGVYQETLKGEILYSTKNFIYVLVVGRPTPWKFNRNDMLRTGRYKNTFPRYTLVNAPGVMTDKNGVELFEGDIFHMGDPKIEYEVVFKGGVFVGRQLRNKSTASISYYKDDIEMVRSKFIEKGGHI